MGFDWNTIREKVSLLYEEMEYRSEYTIQQFEADLDIEKLKKVSFSYRDQRDESDGSNWISRFRVALESRRSILTKLFSFTNNLNSVDTLVEYCDYYKSHYRDGDNHATAVNRLSESPEKVIYLVFIMIAKNKLTESVLLNVWQMLADDVRLEGFDQSKPRPLPATGSFAMVIMADADLNAAIRALISSQHTYFQVFTVLVQEPIKEEFLRTVGNYLRNDIEVSNLFVFRNTLEALGNLNGKEKPKAVSIWSENIIAAKKFSAFTKIDTAWINAHGVLAAGLHSMIYTPETDGNSFHWKSGEDNEATTPLRTLKTWDLFYGGKWQSPANGKYWTNRAGVSFAQATRKDFISCVNAARGAFKLWSFSKLSKRIKIVKSFADRLRANGDSEHADTVLQFVDLPLEFGASLSIARDGEAEISTTSEPIGVVVISSEDQKMLFLQLIIACVTGNAVILVLNSESSVSFAQYCDLLSTCGFPPGVINSLFTTDTCNLGIDRQIIDKLLFYNGQKAVLKTSNLYEGEYGKIVAWRSLFLRVTKPKSIWLQCA